MLYIKATQTLETSEEAITHFRLSLAAWLLLLLLHYFRNSIAPHDNPLGQHTLRTPLITHLPFRKKYNKIRMFIICHHRRRPAFRWCPDCLACLSCRRQLPPGSAPAVCTCPLRPQRQGRACMPWWGTTQSLAPPPSPLESSLLRCILPLSLPSHMLDMLSGSSFVLCSHSPHCPPPASQQQHHQHSRQHVFQFWGGLWEGVTPMQGSMRTLNSGAWHEGSVECLPNFIFFQQHYTVGKRNRHKQPWISGGIISKFPADECQEHESNCDCSSYNNNNRLPRP